MKTKHTPGPWRLNGALVDGQKRWWVEAGSTNPLSHGMSFPATNPTLEDARLIAAAPELKTALEVLLALLKETKSEHYVSAGIDIAQRALAKAEGR